MPHFDVLSYGTIGLDRVIRVPHFPHPDRSTHATEVIERLGGKATNTAALLASWGLNVAVSGTVIGHDPTGEKIMQLIARYPTLSPRFIARRRNLDSMYCNILVTPDGERAIVGVNVESNPQTPLTPEIVGDANILTLDLYGGDERFAGARMARKAHIPVVVGDLREHNHPILDYTDVAIASGAEVRAQYPAMRLAEFADRVLAHGLAGLIITHGAGPVMLFAQGKARMAVHPPEVTVIDSTGAGDALRAGVTFGMLRGLSLDECAALGTAAGSLLISRETANGIEFSLQEVTALAGSLTRTVGLDQID